MRERPRRGLAFFASVALHATLVLWGTCNLGLSIEVPDIELEFTDVELIDPDAIEGAAKAPEPEPPVVVPPPAPPPEPTVDSAGEETPPPEPEPPEPEPEPAKPFAAKASNVDRLGPTNSNYYALLVNKRIRKLPFANDAVEIMAPIPDFQFIIQGGGFDALHDFDYMVIASPDIRIIDQTFLAVEYTMGRDELKAGLERAAARENERMVWEVQGDIELGEPVPIDPNVRDWDPRKFVLIGDRTALFVRPEFLPSILAGPDGDKDTAANFVANLSRLRQFAAREPRAGLQLVYEDLRAAIKSARNLPFVPPDRLELSAEADESPDLAIKFTFLEASEAKQAEQFFVELLPRIIDEKVPFAFRFQARGMYALFKVSREGKVLRLDAEFEQAQAQLVLGMIADGARRMLKRDPEAMAKARAEREAAWAARNGGKLPPSVGRAALEGGAAPADGADTDAAGGDAPLPSVDGGASAPPSDRAPAPAVPTEAALEPAPEPAPPADAPPADAPPAVQ